MEIHVGDVRNPDKKSKTEVLFVAAPPATYTNNPSTYDDKDLSNIDLGNGLFFPIVARFCYLGSILTRDCKDDEDVEARIEAAGNAFGSLRKAIFSKASVSLDAKKMVYLALILTILLYGAESWSLTEKVYRKLRCFHARCVRGMCRVTRWHTRKHKITTNELLKRLKLKSMDAYVTKRHLQWAGHLARMPMERLPRKMMSCWIDSKRPVGCPSFTYGRGLNKSLRKAGIEPADWHVLAQDREGWRVLINSVE